MTLADYYLKCDKIGRDEIERLINPNLPIVNFTSEEKIDHIFNTFIGYLQASKGLNNDSKAKETA